MSYVFYCTDLTEMESLQKGVFGNSYRYWEKVRKIKSGDPVFLINLNNGVLYGPFRASGKPRIHLDPYIFIESKRNYPAQIEVQWGRVMKLDRAFKRLRFLRKGLPCRLTPTETVKVLVELLEEQTSRLQAWA